MGWRKLMRKENDFERLFWKKIKSPVGDIFVGWIHKGLIRVNFIYGTTLKQILVDLKHEGFKPFTVTGGKAVDQLVEYFKGSRNKFSCKLIMRGTTFQIKVWNELLKISYGKNKSYGDIAKAIDNPKAVRAVGGACGANRIAIIIPCHRVIGSDGKLVGYGGGLDKKSWLLYHEAKREWNNV